jgi:hypothetical protein
VVRNGASGLLEVCERQLVRREILGAHPLWYDEQSVRACIEPRLAEARATGRVPVLSHELLVGHPVSGGHNSTVAAERLRALFPGARVLIVIREQRQMLLSLYKQYVRGGGPGSLRRYLHPRGAKRAPVFDFRYLEYDRIIGHYRERFGPGNVLVLSFESLCSDRLAFCSALLEFAGARPLRDVAHSRLNVGLSGFTAAVLGRVNALFDSEGSGVVARRLKGLDAHVPRALASWGDRRLRTLIDREVGQRFADSNRRTAELTGLDLAAHGYA